MICNYDSISGKTSGLDVKNYSPVFIKTLAETLTYILPCQIRITFPSCPLTTPGHLHLFK